VALRRLGRDEWRRVAAGFADHNYRQSWDYAETLAARNGARAEHVCVASGGDPIGLASLRVKGMPGMGTGIAYVSGGPLVRRTDHAAAGSRLGTVLAALAREYVDRCRLVLRVAPPIGDAAWNGEQERRFLAAGFRAAEHVRGYSTVMLDVARPLGEVRAGFAKKWRYHLGRAEKAGIAVVQGTDPALFEDFRPLFDEVVQRKSFAVDLDAGFYAQLQSAFPEGERLHLAIASIDGQPVAGMAASFLGDTAVYLLGASNELGREANAAYLLQWKTIEAAAARDLAWYDLGGIDPDGNPGVYRFKVRMGGAELSAPGPYEIAPGRLRAAAIRTAERVVRAARTRPS
jgi:CelD/BcsL family acetyltransferase involved in cellulose biosynthesis